MKAKLPKQKSTVVDLRPIFAAAGLPEPIREYEFAWEAMGRKWKFDYAWRLGPRSWPGSVFSSPWNRGGVALEIDGGQYVTGGGRHNRLKGYEEDCVKLNEAAILGWVVLRVTPAMLSDGRAIAWLERLLK